MKADMKKDDLTQVKHIGPSRQKMLNDHGITRIEQLYEMPVEKLTEIKNIGPYFAKQLKAAVIEYYREKGEKLPGEAMTAEKKAQLKLNRKLKQEIKRLKKQLNRLNEDLKPLWKKKYLNLYIIFKKKAHKLKIRLDKTSKRIDNLPDEVKKKITKQAGILKTTIKKGSKKPKKKKYKAIIREIITLSELL